VDRHAGCSERWLPCGGWYEVSSCGRVRGPRGNILVPYPRGAGYLAVRVCGVQRYVQRLVCAAFNGEPPNATDHADHRDYDRTNNHAHNLRWLPAHLNLGRQVRYGPRGWERLADELAPDDYQPLSPDELARIDADLQSAGW
jgi:hypothetical protein